MCNDQQLLKLGWPNLLRSQISLLTDFTGRKSTKEKTIDTNEFTLCFLYWSMVCLSTLLLGVKEVELHNPLN